MPVQRKKIPGAEALSFQQWRTGGRLKPDKKWKWAASENKQTTEPWKPVSKCSSTEAAPQTRDGNSGSQYFQMYLSAKFCFSGRVFMPSALQMAAQTPGPLGIPSLELWSHQLCFSKCIDDRTIKLLPVLLYLNTKSCHQFQLFSLQTCKKIQSTAASLRKKLWKTKIGEN